MAQRPGRGGRGGLKSSAALLAPSTGHSIEVWNSATVTPPYSYCNDNDYYEYRGAYHANFQYRALPSVKELGENPENPHPPVLWWNAKSRHWPASSQSGLPPWILVSS